jgi:hypothetical protein
VSFPSAVCDLALVPSSALGPRRLNSGESRVPMASVLVIFPENLSHLWDFPGQKLLGFFFVFFFFF